MGWVDGLVSTGLGDSGMGWWWLWTCLIGLCGLVGDWVVWMDVVGGRARHTRRRAGRPD